IGERVCQCGHLVREQIAAGHEIGNHSWSHRNFEKLSDDELRSELERTRDAIMGCGATSMLMRPPFGTILPRQRLLAKEEFGYETVLWTLDSEDWKLRDAQQIAHRVLTSISSDAIILAHEIHKATIDAMKIVFEALSGSECQFVTVSELKRSSYSDA